MDKVPYTGISRYRRTNRQIWGVRRSLLFALNATFEFRQRNALRSADEEEIGIGKANEARAHQSVIQTKCASGFGFEFTIRRLRGRVKRCDDTEVAICVRAPRSFGIVGLFS
jgi:hypothetical protein